MLSFPFKRYRFTLLDDPTRTMTAEGLAALQARLLALASQRFQTSPDYSYFSDTRHFAGKVIVIAAERQSGQDLCFCALTRLGTHRGRPVVHLGSVFSVAEGRGLMHLLYTVGIAYLFLRSGFWKTMYVTSLTHTPRIFGVVDETFDNVYPGLDERKQPQSWHHDLRDRLLDAYVRPEWNLAEGLDVRDDFVVAGLRRQRNGAVLFPDTSASVPKHRKGAYNERVLQLIDLARGDEVLQVGQIGLVSGLLRKVSHFVSA